MPEREHLIGSAVDYGYKRAGRLTIDVRLTGDRLAISAGWWNPRGTDFNQCGQMADTLRALMMADRIRYAAGWDAARLDHLLEVWDRWHLNDMRAGCQHQRQMGWTSYDDHPSEECPVCGYRYGTAWLVEELPAKVRRWAEQMTAAD